MRRYSELLAEGTVAIFLFHGVVRERRPGVRNSISKHIALERFEEVLGDLTSRGAPVSIDAIARGGALPGRAFAVTFDDGFENNASVAAPALEGRGVPAVFYVTTGFVEANASSWIDRIEYALDRTPEVALELPFGTRVCGDDDGKLALLDEIRGYVKARREVDPDEFAADVWRQLGVTAMEPDPELDRKVSWAQVRALHDHELFTVGGHGHTHRILEHLDDGALERELELSLRLLREHLGGPVEHYSYPEGLAHCYSDRVIEALRRRGVVCAPTAEPGVNRAGGDPFRLKRITVV